MVLVARIWPEAKNFQKKIMLLYQLAVHFPKSAQFTWGQIGNSVWTLHKLFFQWEFVDKLITNCVNFLSVSQLVSLISFRDSEANVAPFQFGPLKLRTTLLILLLFLKHYFKIFWDFFQYPDVLTSVAFLHLKSCFTTFYTWICPR